MLDAGLKQKRNEASLVSRENILELDCRDGCTILWMFQKQTLSLAHFERVDCRVRG